MKKNFQKRGEGVDHKNPSLVLSMVLVLGSKLKKLVKGH